MLYLFAEANTEAIQEQITRWGTSARTVAPSFRLKIRNSCQKVTRVSLLLLLLLSRRVLLERLIVNRPHPWGLLITFIELIKNPAFKFWSHDFVHCAPEIEK